MAALKDLRRKIKGISTTQQITSAMKLMSTARLCKVAEIIKLTHSYISKLEQIVHDLKRELPNFKHPFMIQRPVKSSAIVVIGGERSLCGAFNLDLNNFALKTMSEYKSPDKKIIVIGQKAIRFFEMKKIELFASFPNLTVKTIEEELPTLVHRLFDLYNSEQIDEIVLIYTNFISPVKRYLVNIRLLPIDTEAISKKELPKSDMPFDFYPSAKEIFNKLIPRYLQDLIYRAIIESSAAEQSARRTAMTSATDRAQELIDELSIDLNRSRQAIITREITEVIAGSQ